jgi:phosphoribosylanthranilate isomerase
VFDWSIASKLKIPIILAGGLNEANVHEAIKQSNVGGVDVSSGIESHPGVKNIDVMKQFIKEAKKVTT